MNITPISVNDKNIASPIREFSFDKELNFNAGNQSDISDDKNLVDDMENRFK
jgi:hypothetical protein